MFYFLCVGYKLRQKWCQRFVNAWEILLFCLLAKETYFFFNEVIIFLCHFVLFVLNITIKKNVSCMMLVMYYIFQFLPGYNADGREFVPHTSRPLLDTPTLNGYRSLTENLTTVEKRFGHPTPPCRWPSIMGAAMCPSATPTY